MRQCAALPKARAGDSPSATFVNDRQNEPHATHGVAQFDKKQGHVERRLGKETETKTQLHY